MINFHIKRKSMTSRRDVMRRVHRLATLRLGYIQWARDAGIGYHWSLSIPVQSLSIDLLKMTTSAPPSLHSSRVQLIVYLSLTGLHRISPISL